MDLLQFQQAAATQIAQRFAEYAVDPLLVDKTRCVPFLQTLVSITGSGKTLMLADAVTQVQAHLPLQPIVLWISKGRVVVSQTYENLSAGKYADNLPGFTVKPLLETAPSDIENDELPLLLIATVAKFAREDETGGDRKIFKAQLDLAADSLWTLLKRRVQKDGQRRPLVIVYDEGHNLSDLQTRRLMELAPDALIAASATMSMPKALEPTISRLRNDRGWKDADFTTTVFSKDVVSSGLVKERISIGGYVTPMETAIDGLLADMQTASEAAERLEEPFGPKAIYVCSTNAVDGVPIAEDVRRPFESRLARPVLIWRHLVEQAGIDPDEIAVYCQLKFSKEFPSPPRFHLFAGGDRDYERFLEGRFRHIIFNLGLQEGWDDPFCGFAYIDKEMASTTQITQVIGRVLRQPQAQHHSDPSLNTAHFYIRSDERGVFDDILQQVRGQLASEHPSIALIVRPENRRASREFITPSKARTVPMTAINSAAAIDGISEQIGKMIDFRSDKDQNTVGRGARMQVLQEIGSGASPKSYEWREVEHSNRVTARSIFRREIQRLYAGGLRRAGGPINLVDIELPKFDAMVEVTSPAADHVREVASRVVDVFIERSRIIQMDDDAPYSVGPIAIDPGNAQPFQNALHSEYSGLNETLELPFARALDRTQRVWCRNPQSTGYFIPLLDRGNTATFWPDFLVWIDRAVVAIETKGAHLLASDVRRKLFEIDAASGRARITIRFVSKGKGTIAPDGQIGEQGKDGFTLWRWMNGKLAPSHLENVEAVAKAAVALD